MWKTAPSIFARLKCAKIKKELENQREGSRQEEVFAITE